LVTDIQKKKTMKRTAWATLAMSISFILGTIIAVGSLVSMGGKMDTARLTAAPLSAPTVLITCLDPLAILLEIAAIVLIVLDSRKVGRPHHSLAWAAATAFVFWAVFNLGLFLPISFVGMQRGSLALVKAAQRVKAGAALLQYAIPFLLVAGLTRKTTRAVLWAALILTVVGNFAVVVLPIESIELRAIEAAGQQFYAPQFSVDYTQGVYPILLGLGYTGGALYLIAYGLLTTRLFSQHRSG
jgi:hypothetical protein